MIKKKLRKILAPRLRALKLNLMNVETYFLEKGKQSPFRGRQRPMSQKISLVVATYNVEKYFDAFMRSIVNQSTGLSNVEVIIVDDGSTDASGLLAQKWQSAYPDNIKYFWKENGGQSSARNFGLSHATGDWITFPDPDDFLDRNYFHHVNNALIKGQAYRTCMISCNLIRYYESFSGYRNDHPTNYKYSNREKWVNVSNSDTHFQMFVNSAFFKRSIIEKHEIRFDHKVKPTFEDGHFANVYLMHCQIMTIGFIASAKYNYRKRSDGSSSLDLASKHEGYYLDRLQYGYVDILKRYAENLNHIPHYIQNMILYELIWILKNTINNPSHIDILTEEKKKVFLNNLKTIGSYIDSNVIKSNNIYGLWYEYRIGLLNLLKDQGIDSHRIYLSKIDKAKDLIQLRYFSHTAEDGMEATSGEKVLTKLFPKCCGRKIGEATLFFEHSFWVPVPNDDLSFNNGNLNVEILHGKLSFGTSVTPWKIRQQFFGSPKRLTNSQVRSLRKRALSGKAAEQFHDCWLIMDRVDKADDNGEHFYRYIQAHHPEINAYFVLQKKSKDWNRLAKDGFRMLDFKSDRHLMAVIQSKYIISSHADRFIKTPLPMAHYDDVLKYEFIFLQHGVTQNDISRWFNNIKPSLLVSATVDEYKSIVDKSSNYLSTEKEVKLTGFPRHDRLNDIPKSNEIIFIMPTWREYLVSLTDDHGNRSKKRDFLQSNYAINWMELLNSNDLRQLAQKSEMKVVFCPHPILMTYLKDMVIPEYIEIHNSSNNESLQSLFAKSAVLITDYSSVTFEFAYMNKPTIYFQFDSEEFFTKHTMRRGYFNHDSDGFGPVCNTSGSVIYELERTLHNEQPEIYETRRVNTFPFRDGKCSERVYNAIKALDEKTSLNSAL